MADILTELPRYERTQEQADAVRQERRTAKLIRALWSGASNSERRSAAFLQLLVSLGWLNAFDGEYSESTSRWRNLRIAEFLGLEGFESAFLAKEAKKRWGPRSNWLRLFDLNNHTGITNYYKPTRRAALHLIEHNTENLFQVFSQVARQGDYQIRTKMAMEIIMQIPHFKTPAGGKGNLLNAISPALACLDPDRKFPIMNQRTQRLLAGIGQQHDADGALALADLIGKIPGVHDNLELDVYALWNEHRFPSRKLRKSPNVKPRVVGLKEEQSSLVRISRQTRLMRKLHNKLTNQFRDTIRWKYGTPLEGPYDLLIRDWRKGRDLLVEAKTSAAGNTGRFQIRTAIGQLLDYKYSLAKLTDHEIDLAVLLFRKPTREVIEFLQSLAIDLLWYEKGKLEGTLRL